MTRSLILTGNSISDIIIYIYILHNNSKYYIFIFKGNSNVVKLVLIAANTRIKDE